MNRIKLPDITMVSADCLNPRAALWSFARSLEQCEFAESVLFTDAEAALELRQSASSMGVRIVTIPKIDSRVKYSEFIMRDLLPHLKTEFVLITQWDGFVLNGAAWQSIFKQYDYLGARWIHYDDGLTVGNGGFSLRSKSLMTALQGAEFPPNHPEDEFICRHYRPRLEQEFDLVFGKATLADEFAFERNRVRPDQRPSFGFHGAFNFHRVLSPQQLGEILPMLSSATLVSQDMMELLLIYAEAGRWSEARLLKSFQDRNCTAAEWDLKLAPLLPSASVRSSLVTLINPAPVK